MNPDKPIILAIATFEYEGKSYTHEQLFDDIMDLEDAKNVWYMCEDGNYSCNCNRSLFIRASGVVRKKRSVKCMLKMSGNTMASFKAIGFISNASLPCIRI